MARKPGTRSGNTQTSRGRKATTRTRSSSETASGRSAGSETKDSDERTPKAATARTRKASAQRKQNTGATTTTARTRATGSDDKRRTSVPDFKAVLGSSLVRNAIAAVLASAAAALLYKKSSKSDVHDEGARRYAESNDYDSPSSKRSVAKKARRKAVAAAETVSKSAQTAVARAAKKAAVKTAKAAVEKGAKAAVKKARHLSKVAAAPAKGGEPVLERKPRKARSDAGFKRGSRTASDQSEGPEVVDLTSFASTDEISRVLSDGTREDAAAPATTNEQIAEGHPS